MKILTKPEILKISESTPADIQIKYIEEAFAAYSNGTANVPPVGYLGFTDPPGDVHIKYGYIANDPYYVIKIASGFYNNSDIGLPTGNGMMLAFEAKTGVPQCLLRDEGYLTDLRTGLAGAIAGKHLGPQHIEQIGIIGTGIQARLQLECLGHTNSCRKAMVWGRSKEKAEQYKLEMEQLGYSISIATHIEKVPANCNLIVTTTPSEAPLLYAKDIRPGTHITAMGSDTDGKQELDPKILEMANIVACDSISQCVDHGEVYHAIQAGLIEDSDLVEIGQIITQPIERNEDSITVADLTGIATQDIKITSMILNQESK